MPKDVPKKENGSSAVPLRASAQSSGGAMSKLRQSGVKLLQKTAQRLSMREEAVTAGTSLHGKSGSSSTISDSSGADRERMENETTHGEAGKNGHQELEVGASESKPYMESSKAGKQPHEVKRTRKPHPEPKRPYQREKKAVPPNKLDSKKPVTQPNDVKKHQTPQQTEPKKTGVPQPDGKRPGHPNTPARSASWDVSSPGPSCQPCSEDCQPSVERNTNACTSGAAGSTAGISRSVRPSAVRHRDRGAAKVSFSTCVEMLGPPGGGPSAATEAAEVAEAASAVLQEDEETSARQAESLRKLEQENESLRHAIENYRELERKRNASLSENKPSSGSDAAGQEDALTTNEEGEEDEIEKAIEVSPDGTFLKFSEEIGRGSFKTVYKGLDTTTGVFVAWCELQVVGARLSRKERDRFREEADLMKGLTHPNIVRFYDYWEVDKPKKGCIVLVTELMTSGTLRTYLKNFGQKKVSLKIIKQWCRQILRGLQFLHSRNPPIIHRDLKCDNIFISGTTGQVKVGDLGLATLKNRSFAKSVIGTPEFMAPEVYEEHYDEAVDVYAFGMCMLEMVTAEYPYSECTGPAQIYKKVVAGIKPSSLEKVEDAQVRELIEWCTGLVSQQRPTVKQLLTHQFFAEDCGMRLDIANREETVGSDRNVVELQLRVLDAKKRRDTHKENEAIQFNYVLNKDNPEETAKQMVMSGLLAEENWRPVAKMIVNQIQSLVRAREEKRREQGAPGQTQSTPAATVAATPAGAAAHASVSLPTLAPSSAQTPQQPPPAAPAAAPPSAAHAQSLQQLSGAEAAVTAAAAEEKGSEPQQQQAGTGTANPAEVAADGAVSTESEPGLSEKKERKGRARRRKTCERLPRLTVLEVKSRENGPVVSCLLETNQSQAITFKFDLREADVSAISYKMTELHLLPRDDAQYFEEQLRAVISQQLQAERSEQPAPPAEDQCDASGAGAAATSSGGSPLRRPADLAAPATGASQVPPPAASAAAPATEPAFPVLLRASHGLQIVTLTPQQLSALLQRPPGPLPSVPAPSPALLPAAPAPPAAAAVPAAAAAGTALTSAPSAAPVTGVVSIPTAAPAPLQVVTDTAPTHAPGPGLHVPCQSVPAPHPAEAVPEPVSSALAAAGGAPCALQAAPVSTPAPGLVYQRPPSGPAETTVSASCVYPGLSPPAPSPLQPSALPPQARRQSRFIVSSVVESKPPPSPSSALHSPATESVPFLLPAAAAAVVSAPPSQQAAVLSPASESSEPAQNSHLDSLLDGSDRTASHTPSLPLSTATTPLQVPTAPTPLMSPVVEPTETRPASGVGVSGAVTSTPVSTGAVFKTPAARPPKTFKVTPANAAPPFGTPSVSPEGAAPAQNAAVTPSAAPQPGVAGDKAAGGGMSGVSPHWTGVPAQLPNASQRTVLDGPPPRPAANGSVQHTVQPGNAQNSAEASVPDVSPMVPQVSSANQLPSSVSQNRESPTAWSGLAATAQQPSGAGHQPIPPTCLIPAPPQNNQPAASAGSLVYVVDSLSLKPPVLSETPKAGDVQPLWAAPNGASVPASATPTAPTTAQTTLPSSAGQPSLSPASSTACVPPLAGGGAAVASSASPSPSAAPTAGSALAQTQGGMTAGSSRAAEVPPTLPKSSPSPLGMSAPVAMVSASEGLPSDTAPVAAEAKVPAGSVLTNGAAAPLTTPPMATSLAAVPATLQAPAAPTGGLVTPTGGVAVSRFTAGPSAGPSRSLTSLQPAQAELATPAGATPKQPVTLEGQSSVGNLAHLAEQLTKLTSQPAEVAPPSSAAADGTDPSRRVASAAASATPSAPLRTGDGSGASAARAAAEPGATPQSASDGSRPTSAADTPGGGRKPPPLLLSDLAKELSKIHGKPHLPHVTSTPLLGALEDAAEAAPVSDTVGAPDTGRAPLQLPPSAQHGTANSQSAPAPPAPQCWQQGSVLAQSQPRPADGQAPAQPAAAAAVLPAQPAARPLTPAQAAPADPLTVPAAVAGLPGPAAALPAQRPAATPEDVRAAAPGPPAAPAPAAAAAPTPVSDNAQSTEVGFAISPVSVPPPVGVVASPGAAEAAEATAAPSASLSGTSAAAAQTSDASVGPCSLGETVGSAYHQLLLAVEDTEQYKELLARQQADLAHLQRQQEIERELLRRELRHQQLSAARRRQKEDPAG